MEAYEKRVLKQVLVWTAWGVVLGACGWALIEWVLEKHGYGF